MHEERSNRYDFEGKSNRFMEFISREMMRNKNHKSHAEQPKPKTNVRLIQHRADSSPTTPKLKPIPTTSLTSTHSHKLPGNVVAPVSSKAAPKAVILTKVQANSRKI